MVKGMKQVYVNCCSKFIPPHLTVNVYMCVYLISPVLKLL